MSEQAESALELVATLEQHAADIAAIWAEKLCRLGHSRYNQAPLPELEAYTARVLLLFIDRLRTGKTAVLDAYLQEQSHLRRQSGFEAAEVLEALLLLREVTLPILWQAYRTRPMMALAAGDQLDAGLRYMVAHVASLFIEEMAGRPQKLQPPANLPLETSDSMRKVTSALLQSAVTLEEVLVIVCYESQRLTGASGSAVLLVEDGSWLRVAGRSGRPLPVLERLAIEGSFAGRVVTEGKPLSLNDPEGQVQAYYRNPDLKALLAVPLWADEIIVGVLDVVNKPGGFHGEDVRIISLFADQAAIAIKIAQLHEQAEKLAVIEERQRLARELHDSVTQAIYSVNLYAEAARMALSAGKMAAVAENLHELRNMTREALVDMRMLIFELHQPAWEEEGLASALQARLEAVEARSGLQTEFQVWGNRRMPLSVEEELYRIAQEALTNAVKHAKARKLIVRLNAGQERYYLEIQDDGSGFDLTDAEKSGGMGLNSIGERVRRFGGELAIDTSFGKGTTLRVEVKT